MDHIGHLVNETKLSEPLHPHYPLGVEIVGYLANDKGVVELLSTFFIGCGILFYATRLVVQRIQPNLSKNELLTVMWFVLSKSDESPEICAGIVD